MGATDYKTIDYKSWEEFQRSGLFWAANRFLHLFGWAIVITVNANNEVIKAMPARVAFRGFVREIEDEGFDKLHSYLEQQIPEIASQTRREFELDRAADEKKAQERPKGYQIGQG